MTVVGEAFVAVSPLTTGFAAKLDAEIAGSGFAGDLEKQMSNAGILGGNAFANKIANALKISGLSVGASFGVEIAAAAVVGLALIGHEFDKARKQIESETGATGALLTGLANTVTAAFKVVPVSLSTAASAVDELYRRGVPLGPQLTALAEQELFLAKITKSELAPTVEATTGLMQRFNIPIADQSRELDVLFKAYQGSGKSLDTLTSGLQTGGAVLQQFGLNLDSSAALLGQLEHASVTLQPVLAGLRLAFGKITKEGADPKAVLQALFKEFTDGTPRAKAAADAIQLFGTRSGAELTIAIEKGTFNVTKFLKTITDGQGGIIATGLATLTLGDQFKLLRNNIEAALSGVGTTVLHDLESGLAALAAPLEHLVAGFADLVVALAPGIADLALLAAPLALLAPLLDAVSGFVEGVASGLNHVPKPLLAVAEGLALLSLAVKVFDLDLVAMTTTLLTTGVVLDTVFAPVTLIVGAIALLGAAFHSLGTDNARLATETKAMSGSLLDSHSATGVFATGIKDAAQGLREFLDAQIAAGKSGDLVTALNLGATNTTALSTALAGGTGEWVKYRDAAVQSAIASAAAMGKSANDQGLFGLIVKGTLEQQRKAFDASTEGAIAQAVALNQLSPAQAKLLATTFGLGTATADYGGALDALNVRLAASVQRHNEVVLAATSTKDSEAALTRELAAGTITDADVTAALKQMTLAGPELAAQLALIKDGAKALNETIDLTASKTVPTTAAYADLERKLALGTITTHDATAALRAMGFSADGVGAALSTAQSAVSTFMSSAMGALPQVSKAISDFASAISSDQSQLQSDQKQSVTLQDRLATSLASSAQHVSNQVAAINAKIAQDQANIADGSVSTTKTLDADLARRTVILQTAASKGGQASASLTAEIVKNNAAIHADFAKIVADNDPAKFTALIVKQATDIARFGHNLAILVKEGFGGLAGELAKQGPEAAGALAAGFAGDKGKAKMGNAALLIRQHTVTSIQHQFEKSLPELATLGETTGEKLGSSIADGLAKELVALFPSLATSIGSKASALFGSTVIAPPKIAPPQELGALTAYRLFGGAHGTAYSNEVIHALRSHGEAVGNAAAAQLTPKPGTLEAGVAGAVAGIVAKAKTQNDLLVAGVDGAVAAIRKRGPVVNDAGVLFGQSFVNGVASKTPAATTAATTLGQSMIGPLAAAAPLAKTAGGSIVNGLILGLAAQTPAAVAAAVVVTAAIVTAIRTTAHVKSPSEITTQIGHDIGAGLAVGMTASTSTVSGAGAKIAATLTSSLDHSATAANAAALRLAHGVTDTFTKSVFDTLHQKPGLLLNLPVMHFAPPTLPSPVLVAQAAQSLAVPAPQDRADARAQQAKAQGVFAGATINFPHVVDPIHIANELAWKLL
jgi:phage-related minor tail protein